MEQMASDQESETMTSWSEVTAKKISTFASFHHDGFGRSIACAMPSLVHPMNQNSHESRVCTLLASTAPNALQRRANPA
jgi:hypothetical protein